MALFQVSVIVLKLGCCITQDKAHSFIEHLLCHADISHAKHPMIKDLWHRGEKNVLVTKGQASAIDPDVAAQYSTVERMDPCIEKYCNVYAKDLAERLSLNERNLPDALATPTLLNPMFGSKKRIVGSGLMSEG